jgi:Domain of unknown function (DUF5658)
MFDLPELTLADALPLAHLALVLTVAVFVLLQLLDVVTTLCALSAGAQEVNPLVRWLQGCFGHARGLVLCKLLMLVLLAAVVRVHGWPSPWVWAVLDAFYVWVVWHNARLALNDLTR